MRAWFMSTYDAFSNVHNRDNVTVTYGQNLGPIEPFSSLFDYKKHRSPEINNLIPRRWPRSVMEPYPPFEQNMQTPGRWKRSIRPPMGLDKPSMDPRFVQYMVHPQRFLPYPVTFYPSQFRRRRKYRIIPNYHFVYY
uniref:Uncharacterized protein n=1 Tax=Caenorhabditis japonica TaxID=281687 RepID=A0A8R1EQK0_CAEJA